MTTNQAQARERLGNQTGHHIAVALLVVVYALVLAGVYEFVVSPRFTYLAFVSVEPDLVLVLWDAILCGILALLLPGSVSKPSELGRILVFFFVTVPALVIPTFLSEVWTATLVETKFYGVVAFLLLSGVLVLFDHRGSPLKIPGDTALYALLGVALVAVVLLGSSYGFSIQIHALTDVYSQREIYSAGGGGRGVVGLAAGLLQNVLAPIFLVVGMQRRSMLYFSVGLMLSLYIYTITGLKSALIGVAFVTAIYWLARRTNATTFARGWSLGAIAFVVGAWVVSSTPVFSTAIDLVVRRILTMQGLLTYNYVRIFGEEEPTYFTHTILGSMAAERFDGSPPKIVGEDLFGRSVHANASFVADGYVGGKLLGVLLATLTVALFFAVLDSVTTGLDSSVRLASVCMAIYIVTQSGVTAMLINHGGLALIGCLWLAGSALSARPPTDVREKELVGLKARARSSRAS